MTSVNAVRSAILTTEGEKSLRVDYFITSGICLTDGAGRAITYGIRADLSVDGKFEESAKVEDISPSEQMVRETIDLLAQNNVTPVALKDVVEDCVAMQYDA